MLVNTDPTWARHDAHFRALGPPLDDRENEAVDAVIARIPPRHGADQGMRAIDLGCGSGSLTKKLSERGFDAVGVDSNRSQIRSARTIRRSEENKGSLKFFKADATRFIARCRPNSVDVLTAFHIVEHLKPKALPKFFRHAYQMLRPGGLFVIEVPNLENLRVGASTVWLDQTHMRPLHHATVEFFLKEVGFMVEISFEHPLDPLWAEGESETVTELRRRVDGPADTRLYATRLLG